LTFAGAANKTILAIAALRALWDQLCSLHKNAVYLDNRAGSNLLQSAKPSQPSSSTKGWHIWSHGYSRTLELTPLARANRVPIIFDPTFRIVERLAELKLNAIMLIVLYHGRYRILFLPQPDAARHLSGVSPQTGPIWCCVRAQPCSSARSKNSQGRAYRSTTGNAVIRISRQGKLEPKAFAVTVQLCKATHLASRSPDPSFFTIGCDQIGSALKFLLPPEGFAEPCRARPFQERSATSTWTPSAGKDFPGARFLWTGLAAKPTTTFYLDWDCGLVSERTDGFGRGNVLASLLFPRVGPKKTAFGSP